tara:strand:+ start:1857 stop:3020 length:1164 start_codon:yes stop_codon:yes gene_type:complete
MHHFIFPSQDTWVSSGSSTITGESFKDQNFGRDQILEVKKEFFNNSFDHQTRALVQFSGDEFTELSKSVADGTIASDAKYYLRLYEAEGNAELGEEYTLAIQPLSQSWTEGTGKFGDNPKNTNGCSWENRSNPIGGTATVWDFTGIDGDHEDGPAILGNEFGTIFSSSTQAFSNEAPDVNVEVTDMVNMWLEGRKENYGMVVRFNGASETDSTTFGHLKFFSRNTHTIYSPKLEVRWDDHLPCTGSNTGSLTELTSSGLADNFLYMKGLRESYKVGERVKFRVGARKRYIQKTFSNSVQTVTGSFIAESSGSYAIKDVATDEFIVPFEDNQDTSYTKLSCDSDSNYFIQYLDGFYPDRVYKILLKLKLDDGQEQVFDDDFEFIVKRK